MNNRWSNRILLWLAGGTPLLFVLDLKDTFDLAKLTFVYCGVILLAGIWFWSSSERKEIIIRQTPLDLPLITWLAVGLVATYFSIDRSLSFWGAYRIYVFGWMPMAATAALYWFTTQMADPALGRRISRAVMIAGGIVGFYALLQYFGVELFDRMPRVTGGRPWSSLGNPLYMGAVCMMSIAVGVFEWNGIWILPFVLAAVGLVLSLSRSAWLGAIVAVGLRVWLEHGRRESGWKSLGIGAVFLALMFTCFPQARQRAAVLLSTQESSNAARVGGWKGAVAIWKTNPLLGSGPDTFFEAFRPHRSIAFVRAAGNGVTQADAHNDFLQVGSTMGGTGFLVFVWGLAGVIRVIRHSLRSAGKTAPASWKCGMAAALVALLIQDLFNFSSVSTTTWAALFLGLLAGTTTEAERVSCRAPSPVLRLPLILLLAGTGVFVARPIAADYFYARAMDLAAGHRMEESLHAHRTAVRLHGRVEEYETAYANRCRDTARFDEAWAAADRLTRDHPANPDVWNNKGVVAMWITQLAHVDRMPDAQTSFQHATELDPVFADAWANLAKWEHLSGHLDKEKTLWEKVLDIEPNHEMARQVLGR